MINGLWEKYQRGELSTIHCSDDPVKKAALEDLIIQADRLIDNLNNHFTNMIKEQIRDVRFSDIREVDNEV